MQKIQIDNLQKQWKKYYRVTGSQIFCLAIYLKLVFQKLKRQ